MEIVSTTVILPQPYRPPPYIPLPRTTEFPTSYNSAQTLSSIPNTDWSGVLQLVLDFARNSRQQRLRPSKVLSSMSEGERQQLKIQLLKLFQRYNPNVEEGETLKVVDLLLEHALQDTPIDWDMISSTKFKVPALLP